MSMCFIVVCVELDHDSDSEENHGNSMESYHRLVRRATREQEGGSLQEMMMAVMQAGAEHTRREIAQMRRSMGLEDDDEGSD